MLNRVQSFCEEMNASNSNIHKADVLERYLDLAWLLHWVYSPFKQFYITSGNVKKNRKLSITADSPNDIMELLKLLNSRTVTGYAAIATVKAFIDKNADFEKIIYNIIDKDLKIRFAAKSLNKVLAKHHPEAEIPLFEVALANPYKDFKKSIFSPFKYYASHKLNGIRCLTVIDPAGDVQCFSREGLRFITLIKLEEEIKTLNLKGVVLDGECCIVDENGEESWNAIIRLFRKKEYAIPNPKYKLFDCIPYNDFFAKYSPKTLMERQDDLKQALSNYTGTMMDIEEQTFVDSQETLDRLQANSREKGWEGLILRADVPYEGKRSNALLKVKDMQDGEFTVLGITCGMFQCILKGQNTEIETMLSAQIEYCGQPVDVGSGYTLKERMDFYKNPELIVGKEITVQYFEPTTNLKNTSSLQFPTFKGIRDYEV